MKLQTFSFFQSGKNGINSEVELAHKIVSRVKACRLDFLNKFYDQMMTPSDKELLSEFIPKQSVLIPLPKSAPLVDGAQWPSIDICKFLLSKGYGESVFAILERVKAVPKAAFQVNADERPSVKNHYETIQLVNSQISSGGLSEIILVDDVVTQGRMGIGCYLRISEIFPEIPIKLFCLIRTNTFISIEKCILPKQTEITYNHNTGKTNHLYG